MPDNLALPEPGGGLAFLVARLPFYFSLLFCPPSPKGKDIPPTRARRALFPSGEGGDLKFSYARGFAPCIPGAEPGRHRLFLWKASSGGGLRLLRGGVRGGVAVPGGGLARVVACLPFYFSLLFCLHPPDPLPGGKGETKGYFMQGASPLASPALNRLRHLQTLPFRYPGASLPWNRA